MCLNSPRRCLHRETGSFQTSSGAAPSAAQREWWESQPSSPLMHCGSLSLSPSRSVCVCVSVSRSLALFPDWHFLCLLFFPRTVMTRIFDFSSSWHHPRRYWTTVLGWFFFCLLLLLLSNKCLIPICLILQNVENWILKSQNPTKRLPEAQKSCIALCCPK